MTIGVQELVTLAFVAVVVGFALYRRWRKRRARASDCADCAGGPTKKDDEIPVRIYRRHD